MPCILCGAHEDNPHTAECPTHRFDKIMQITLEIERKSDPDLTGRAEFECQARFDNSTWTIRGTSIGEMLLNLLDVIRKPIALKLYRR